MRVKLKSVRKECQEFFFLALRAFCTVLFSFSCCLSGAMMIFNKINRRIPKYPPRADKSAIIRINLRAERRSLDVVGTRFIASHGLGRRGNVTPHAAPWDPIYRVP